MQDDDPLKGQHEEAQRGAQHNRAVSKRSQQGEDLKAGVKDRASWG